MAVLTSRQGRHRRPRRRLFYVALIIALAGIVIGAISYLVVTGRSGPSTASPTSQAQPPVPRVGPGVSADWPVWGFTHTQNSIDGPAGGALDTIRDLLSRRPVTQNQHIMGWGADNPEPYPGRYQFGSLDRRMDMIRNTRGTPVITLCCAPDWMKGGAPGETDWAKLEVAPRREHYDDFARLAAQVARRYPDVKHYAVWNEFKGFFDEKKKRWRYEDYTDLYNAVYTALKEVDPDIKVGGPYVVMGSRNPGHPAGPSKVRGEWGSLDPRNIDAVEYWLKHKRGADFIVVDGHTQPDEKHIVVDEFKAIGKFSAVTRWLRQASGDLPVWWAEWYVEPENAGWSNPRRSAVLAAAMMEFVRSGVATALYWNPQTEKGDCAGCLWTGGGEPTPDLEMLQGFARWFPPGTELQDVRSSTGRVRVLAQPDQMVIVNTGGGPVRTVIEGKTYDLGAHEVRWADR
ncbi:GH39 family glycosyl hydrolase [Actinomadura craniellae]|uniref:GH39 family glycosyl hydrolase n=1 Tax=Actinomadura craniellae TaxID=2231787 RepID=UPI0018F11E3E|nr:xylan 1,4-beta-xylosidase [Actinomadura craniellae]